MQKWEYISITEKTEIEIVENIVVNTTLRLNEKDYESRYVLFQQLGADGWELATAVPYNIPFGGGGQVIAMTTLVIYHFKRPIE